MSRADEAIDAMTRHDPHAWYWPGDVAALMNVPPKVGRRAVQHAHAEGKVRRDEHHRFQVYDVRGRIAEFVQASGQEFRGAWNIAQALPELGLTRDEVLGHLVALVAEGRIDAWFGVNMPDEQTDVMEFEINQRGGAAP